MKVSVVESEFCVLRCRCGTWKRDALGGNLDDQKTR